jgi:DNA mismatch repair protein MutS
VVEFLHNRKELSARTLFATHYHELTALADVLPRVANAHVAVREDGGSVVFEHRIVPGPSDRSYGIHVARLAGLPAPVVARAEHLLEELERGRAVPEPLNGAPGPPLFQPSFFAGPSPVEAELKRIDPDALTPLEAIQRLYELRALMPPEARRP